MKLAKTNIKSILVGLALLGSVGAKAQVAGGSINKLLDLYVQDDYEKCYSKAMSYTKNDKYKSLSEPYLYVSMCLIKFSEDPEMEEFYPNAIKDAIKYGAKFKKKDDKLKKKDKDYLYDENKEFLSELKELALREGKTFFVQDKFRKASAYYKLGVAIDPEDPVMRLMKGVSNLFEKNTKLGNQEVQKALEQFEKLSKEGYKVDRRTEQGFVDAFYYYAQFLRNANRTSDLEDLVSLARKLDPENEKFKKMYKEVMG